MIDSWPLAMSSSLTHFGQLHDRDSRNTSEFSIYNLKFTIHYSLFPVPFPAALAPYGRWHTFAAAGQTRPRISSIGRCR
jgi:hypothetical protein